MDINEHYFKVDRKILSLSYNSLSKKALILYILYCRTLNMKKNLGCSFLGYNGCSKYLKNKEAYIMAKKELIQKHLIVERPEVKTGILKTVAVEVLNFPDYETEKNIFKLDNKCEHNHRTYRKDLKQYINIPSEIINNGLLKEFSISDMYGLLFLYSELDYKNYLGINFNTIHALNTNNKKGFNFYKTFGEGFSKELYKKNCMQVLEPNVYFLNDDSKKLNLVESINNFFKINLVEFVPVIIETDNEDSNICGIVEELFKGNVEFENDKKCKELYLLKEPENGQKIIWIIRPVFPIVTVEYKLFKELGIKRNSYEFNRYHYFDISTSEESKRKLIIEDYFESYLADWKPHLYIKVEKYFKKGLNDYSVKEIIKLLPDYVFKVYENLYKVL